jgi:hypothetical protein
MKETYKYDEKGNKIEENHYEPSTLYNIQYVYDKNGNWIKSTFSNNGVATSISIREIEYYTKDAYSIC